MKKYSIVIAMVLVLALTVSTFAASFADVPSNHWAYEAVNKLVAAGLIQGYPDGTFKGQNDLTRYEIAVMLARLLNDIEEARAELVDQVDFMVNDALISANSGLSAAEAEEVQAIVAAVIAKNAPEEVVVEAPEDVLTQAEADAVAILVDVLSVEFASELADLGVQVADLEARTAALETVTFSGEWKTNFNRTNVYGDKLVNNNTEAYFIDPFDANDGDINYDDDGDEDTNNEFGTPVGDYRANGDEDYYEDTNEITNELDLNIAVNKGPLAASINMKAFKNVFGNDGDDTDFDFDSIEGTLTNGDFTATVKNGQKVAYKNYLYNDAEVDGVVVDVEDAQYFITKKVVEEDKQYTKQVAGDEDEYYTYKRDHLLVGIKQPVDFVLPMNVYVGYEYAPEVVNGEYVIGDDDWDTTNAPTGTSDLAEKRNTLVAVDTTADLGEFDVTADLGFNVGQEALEGNRLFRLGAVGTVGILDVTANFENTQNMVFIEEDTDEFKKGYDFEVASSFDVVDASFKREDYDTSDNTVSDASYVHTFKLAVAEGKVNFAEFDVDGKYELELGEDDAKNEIRNLNVKRSIDKLDLAYGYTYDADNNIKDAEKDRYDDGDNSNAITADDDDDWVEEDDDTNEHLFTASYAVTENITASLEHKMSKDIATDATDIEWVNDFANETTIKARYTADMVEAGFKKVLDGGDLSVDGKVTAPTYTVLGFDADAMAAFEHNFDAAETENTNVEFNVDLAKAISEKLNFAGGFGWANKEIDVDFKGTKMTVNAGLDYKVTEDITANADYNFLNFEEAVTADEYSVNEVTAGVSVAF